MKISNTIYHKNKHLSEDELLPRQDDSECCSLCKSKKLKEVWVLQHNPHISLRKCSDCRAVGSSRIPTSLTLDSYYSKYYPGICSKKGAYTLGAPKKLALRISSQFSFAPGKPVTILDFGGGDGTVAYLLGKELVLRGAGSVSITVVDYEPRTIQSTLKEISIVKRNKLEEISAKYSIVIASAVIEHHPYPKDLLGKVLNAVDERGLFYARTPYMLPLMNLMSFFGLRLDFTFPAHLYDFGQEFWEKIFSKSILDFKLLISRPSIVETTFSQNFLRTLIAYILKAPWYILGKRYGLVGGWEVFAVKKSKHI